MDSKYWVLMRDSHSFSSVNYRTSLFIIALITGLLGKLKYDEVEIRCMRWHWFL